ncbi:hypothetical protein [Luteibacter sp.]|uniref:hypothetical protein n=1 Tax=Luteibacter sp. TaxID=1886636 RepID=UPI003F8017C4
MGSGEVTSHTDSASEGIDWLKTAKHIISAAEFVEREKVLILVKFDGERENGRICTVDIDGNGNDSLNLRSESRDLQGAVSNAFPLAPAIDETEARALGDILMRWDGWARAGYVLGLQIFWNGESVFYSVYVLGERGAFERIGVRGSALLDVMIESARQVEART